MEGSSMPSGSCGPDLRQLVAHCCSQYLASGIQGELAPRLWIPPQVAGMYGLEACDGGDLVLDGLGFLLLDLLRAAPS